MKNFLYYLSITVIIALVIYFFGVYLALIVIIVLIVYFHEEFFGLCIIVQFLFSIYMFLTNHETQVIVFKFTCLLSGMFCLGCTCNKFFGNKDDDYEDSNKTMEKIFRWSLGIFIFSAFYLYAEPSQKKSTSNVPTVSYQTRRDYDSRSSSSYRHSEPISNALPEKISTDKIDFPAQPPETEKIVDTESAMPPQDKEENNKQIFSERSDKNVAEFEASSEEKDISASPTKIGLIDDWEYVTTDEYGNKYYINKNFGTYSTTTSFEGTVVSARFKKVLSNGGCEIEVPAYDINKGMMITKKRILAYEESIIRFRNENGFKEISFSTTSGYDSNDSIIVGYGVNNINDLYKWQQINNEVFHALYDATYKRL